MPSQAHPRRWSSAPSGCWICSSASEDGLTFSDLVRALGISKGSLHGLLKSLERARAVEQVDGRRYVVGPRIYDLALAYSQRAGLRRFALPGMRRLADEIGEDDFPWPGRG